MVIRTFTDLAETIAPSGAHSSIGGCSPTPSLSLHSHKKEEQSNSPIRISIKEERLLVVSILEGERFTPERVKSFTGNDSLEFERFFN